jgi:hypothetical protein
LAQVGDQSVDECRLAGAWRSGDAEEPGAAKVRAHRLHQSREPWGRPLAFGGGLGDSATLARAHPGDKI